MIIIQILNENRSLKLDFLEYQINIKPNSDVLFVNTIKHQKDNNFLHLQKNNKNLHLINLFL